MSLALKKRALSPVPTDENTQPEAGTKSVPLARGTVDTDLLKKKLIAYHQINELFQNSELNVNQKYSQFLELTTKILKGNEGSLWLFEPDGKTIYCKCTKSDTGAKPSPSDVPSNIEKTIANWVIEKKKGTVIKNLATDSRFKSVIESDVSLKEQSRRSLLATPLNLNDGILGVIEVSSRNTQEEFSPMDLSFLSSMCTPLAMQISSMNLDNEKNRLVNRLDAVRKLQEAFGTTMELKPLLELVMHSAIELLGAEVGSIWLVEESGEGIECQIAEGPTKDKVIGVKIRKSMGIIGWVVTNCTPEIVVDCSKDSRFSASMDKKIGFETRSMISAPLVVKNECIGAIQIINKKDRSILFNNQDLEFLQLFAGNAAMYIKNARLYSAEKKAKELSALLNISQQITSTLDLDAVLMSIVNLSSDIIPYDRAVLSTLKKNTENEFVIRAISGLERIDQEDAQTQTLKEIHRIIAKEKNEMLILNKEEISKESVPTEIKLYMQAKNLESFWATTLKDDQGDLGVFSLESGFPGLLNPAKKELLSLLINQSTVALRNADLYSAIPSALRVEELQSKFFAKLKSFKEWSPQRHLKVWSCVAVVLGVLIFVRIPYTVSSHIEVTPIANSYFAESSGKIAEILVKEGELVKAGQTLAVLDTTEIGIQRQEKEANLRKAKAEMFRLFRENKVAEGMIKEKEVQSFTAEMSRIERQMANAQVKASIDGIVISENLRDLIGKPLTQGQEVIKIAHLDQVMVEFQVPEEDVVFVRPEQTVKFKVFGHPTASFDQDIKLISVAGEGKALTEGAPEKYFIARAIVKNSGENFLRPGMTGRGKISGESQPLWYIILERPIRFILNRLMF